MEHLLLSCIESRVENNRSFYGRFQLGPFDAGQSLTVANALRRTLLSELTGLAITCVKIDSASHEYSTLRGVRESVLNILLNLKQIVLTSNYRFQEPQIGYLNVQGPAIVTSSDLKLPISIRCVDPEQHIATLSHDGVLKIKFVISQGKNYTIQTPLEINETFFDRGFSLNKNKFINIETISESFVKNNYDKLSTEFSNYSLLSNEKANTENLTLKNQKNYLSENAGFPRNRNFTIENEITAFLPSNFQNLLSNQIVKNPEILDQAFSGFSFFEKKNYKKFNMDNITKFLFSIPNNNSKVNNTEFDILKKEKNTNILTIDAVFMPVNKVNFTLETDDEYEKIKERIILEIWTNGSIHPRQAIHEAAKSLIRLFFPFQETKLLKSVFSNSSKLFQKNTNKNRENFKNFTKKDNLALDKKRSSIDIGNLDLSLRPYTCLKRANINTVGDILHYSADELLLLKNFGKRSLEEVETNLAQLGLKLRNQSIDKLKTYRKKT